MLQRILTGLTGGIRDDRDDASSPSSPKPRADHPNLNMHVLGDEVLDGFSLSDIACRACSGFGNCGFKQYFVKADGTGAVSICMMARKQLQCKRDGISFSVDLI